jgi:hypothetical protein
MHREFKRTPPNSLSLMPWSVLERPDVGSSKKTILHGVRMPSRAIITRLRWPPDTDRAGTHRCCPIRNLHVQKHCRTKPIYYWELSRHVAAAGGLERLLMRLCACSRRSSRSSASPT